MPSLRAIKLVAPRCTLMNDAHYVGPPASGRDDSGAEDRAITVDKIIANFPAALRAIPQWVLWRFDSSAGKNQGKCRIPQLAATEHPRLILRRGDRLKKPRPRSSSPLASTESVSYFPKDDAYCGIDLDACRDPVSGTTQSWADEIILDLASYTEITPSGAGFHIIVEGSLPPGGRKKATSRCTTKVVSLR